MRHRAFKQSELDAIILGNAEGFVLEDIEGFNVGCGIISLEFIVYDEEEDVYFSFSRSVDLSVFKGDFQSEDTVAPALVLPFENARNDYQYVYEDRETYVNESR